MIVRLTPLEYAKSRIAFWEKTLKSVEATPIGRGYGKLPANRKYEHQVRCRAAIAALKEVTEVQYAPPVGGRKRKAKTTNLPEISPPEAGGMLTCDDCGAQHPGRPGDRCPETGPHPENGKHTGYLQ